MAGKAPTRHLPRDESAGRRRWLAPALALALACSTILVGLSPTGPGSAAAPSASPSALAPASAASIGTSEGLPPLGAPPLANLSSLPAPGGPRGGTLTADETTSGAVSLDPAVADDSTSFEPILNVYQTLVTFNGTSTGSLQPELSTCVPGSVQCRAEYGTSLIVGNATGVPTYFTFPIDPGARFYDPSTGASWPVYPSDVAFSLARSLSFADLPSEGYTSGWILAQALLPSLSNGWEGGFHSPFNNTPGWVLGSMLVNDTAYCPASALAQNGCVTFVADGGGQAWPYFTDLLANPLGASIVPCGWFTAVGAAVPGFSGTTAPGGDGPCELPGGARNSTDASFQEFLADTPPTYWDRFQSLALNWPDVQPGVQWHAVGSGPYYLASVSPHLGYGLDASPAYAAPIGCAGGPGCEPLPGTYLSPVQVHWSANDSAAIRGFEDGGIDLGDISDPSTLSALSQAGELGIRDVPGLSTYSLAMNFDVNLTGSGETAGTSLPSDFFAQLGLRQFIVHTFPYATAEQTVWTRSGLSYGIPFGGAIPQFLGGYYPANISWPAGNPVASSAVPGGSGWWWAQANNASSPVYDPELANCAASNPCRFVLAWETTSGSSVPSLDLLAASINQTTGGRIQPSVSPDASVSCALPCTPTISALVVGQSADYPDPTDFVQALYAPDARWIQEMHVASQLALPAYQSPGCGHGSGSWTDLVYWSGIAEIPGDCQGVAYRSMTAWLAAAGTMVLGPERTLEYNLCEQVANGLALYLYIDQGTTPVAYAPWIDPATVTANPMIAGLAQEWYAIRYATSSEPVTFEETGLPAGSAWSMLIGSLRLGSDGASMEIDLAPGTYNYSVVFSAGYTTTPSSGDFTVVPGEPREVGIAFTQFAKPAYPLSLTQSGIVSGSVEWSIALAGLGTVISRLTSLVVSVPVGEYPFQASPVPGYSLTAPSGAVNVSTAGGSVEIAYLPTFANTYPVTVTETGLPAGTNWIGSANGFSQPTTETFLVFYEVNGTYSFSSNASDFQSANGTFLVDGGPAKVTIPFTRIAFDLTFSETGLPSGARWAVSLANTTLYSTDPFLVFTERNGTYLYTIQPVAGFTTPVWSGEATMNGTPVSVFVGFSSVIYRVLFEETGLSEGQRWSVELGTSTANSTSTTLVFSVPNGTFAFQVIPIPQYTTDPFTGQVTVNGTPTGASIAFHYQPPVAGTPSWIPPLLVGATIGIAVAALVVYLLARRIGPESRRPPPP